MSRTNSLPSNSQRASTPLLLPTANLKADIAFVRRHYPQYAHLSDELIATKLLDAKTRQEERLLAEQQSQAQSPEFSSTFHFQSSLQTQPEAFLKRRWSEMAAAPRAHLQHQSQIQTPHEINGKWYGQASSIEIAEEEEQQVASNGAQIARQARPLQSQHTPQKSRQKRSQSQSLKSSPLKVEADGAADEDGDGDEDGARRKRPRRSTRAARINYAEQDVEDEDSDAGMKDQYKEDEDHGHGGREGGDDDDEEDDDVDDVDDESMQL